MGLFEAFWLAVLQGLTEFLPVSSSGHLVLVPAVLGWPDQGLEFDVAVHVGTLLAVVTYFRSDLYRISLAWVRSVTHRERTVYARLAWAILFATFLMGVAGLLFGSLAATAGRDPVVIACASIGFGVLLGIADKWGKRERALEDIAFRDVLVIGLAQVMSIIPGASRSGVTLTAGLMMGMTREAAARFSFLLSVPVIFLAGVWQGNKLLSQPVPVDWPMLALAVLVSASVAFSCIHFFLRYLRRFSIMPFVWYRVALGMLLLYVFL